MNLAVLDLTQLMHLPDKTLMSKEVGRQAQVYTQQTFAAGLTDIEKTSQRLIY